jgi:tetratricopeptide (TPR) repeat protein
MGKDDYNQAIKYLNMAMDFAPSEAKLHYMAGLVCYKEEKKEEALRNLSLYDSCSLRRTWRGVKTI